MKMLIILMGVMILSACAKNINDYDKSPCACQRPEVMNHAFI